MPVFVALGANVGEPLAQLRRAVERLSAGVRISAVSNVYLTEPVGFSAQPDFYNLVLGGTTDLTVFDLHRLAEGAEREIGRVRTVRDGPRLIDVDLLAYGELAMESEELTIPHPRLHFRRFVVEPLAEIAPGWRHPVIGRTAAGLLELLEGGGSVVRLGPLREE
ncbi:MAG: 2-amino-4-hydroxy-6-hydroxymethyldihydropteridine diphosphokinase [Gemmatimonadota bacterium]